jgi:hypothetical protein
VTEKSVWLYFEFSKFLFVRKTKETAEEDFQTDIQALHCPTHEKLKKNEKMAMIIW